MPTTNSILKFVDDSGTTVDILASTGTPTNYQLAYGATQFGVSQRKVILLSGEPNYLPVLETLTLNIVSTVSAADCISKLRALVNLLDQAQRWYDGEFVAGVSVWYQPKGSALTNPSKARIIANDTDRSMLSLPALYDDVGTVWRILGVQIKFWRMGLWLNDTDTGTFAATANGSIASPVAVSNSTGVASPCDITITGLNGTSQPYTAAKSVLILADTISGNSRIISQRASLLATGAYTSVADAANSPKFATVLRYTPATTSFVDTAVISRSAILGRVCAVYATVRNNSATTQFRVKVRLVSLSGSSNYTETQEVLIDNSSAVPRVVNLGVLTVPPNSSLYQLSVAATAASGSLDIDNIVFVTIDDETTAILEFDAFSLPNDIGSGAITLRINHNQGALDPTIHTVQPTYPDVLGAAYGPAFAPLGRLPVMCYTGQKNYIWLLMSNSKWTHLDTTPTIVSLTLAYIRQRSYVVPE